MAIAPGFATLPVTEFRESRHAAQAKVGYVPPVVGYFMRSFTKVFDIVLHALSILLAHVRTKVPVDVI